MSATQKGAVTLCPPMLKVRLDFPFSGMLAPFANVPLPAVGVIGV